VLDENRDYREDDEDVRFENEEAKMALNWRINEEERTEDEEKIYLYVSSAARDVSRWESPGNYQIILNSEVDNIIESSLVQASFPLSDPTVNSDNNTIRYSFSPFTDVKAIEVPVGSYKGEALAIEITKQMNMDLFSVDIIAGTYKIDEKTGYIVVPASGDLPAGIDQFRVTFRVERQMFTFQMIDDSELSQSSTVFAMHVQPVPVDTQIAYRKRNDDLYYLLGFERHLVEVEGSYDAGSNTYYLINTSVYPSFGSAGNVDDRLRYSVHSNIAADLRGNRFVILDIEQLNDNDIEFVDDGVQKAFNIGNCFGIVPTRDPANVSDRMLEINSTGYPIKKYYRQGVSRLNRLSVKIRRPDGSINNFGGLDHFMTILLTVKRSQPKKSVFVR
jgi:hypothetical protein